MRKYDRNALFNIALKALLFVAVFAGTFCILRFALNLGIVISLASSAIAAFGAVILFSCLLRYTGFYFGYYSFVSRLLFRNISGEVYCPCCGKSFDSFKDERFYEDKERFNPDVFTRARQDVICDFCRSAPRHRIIATWADKNIDILKNSKILYFAPELSMMLWFKQHGIHVKTADLYDKRAELKLDITALDLPSESEDIIFCNHVLEHVLDHVTALSEMHRVLRKGGILVISFPIDDALAHMREDKDASAQDRLKLFGQNDHIRLFGNDSKKMLEDAGFEVEVMDTDNMPAKILPVTGPADYDTNKVFCCTRK